MKIVTYNVNGLRPRVSQFGSLRKLLDSLDADIICFQETKLSRQDLTADLVITEGYECFFSCTRTSDKGRVSYSGVATFCRVKSAFSSTEVALPLATEEGFTGVLEGNGSRSREDKELGRAKGLEEFTKEELLKVDFEGRCVVTDHCHFVLFNIYGPRAQSDDTERIQFKFTFFRILQKRWEFLLNQGRRIVVVGDLNIAPAAIDSCNPRPDFDKNMFRRWFRSMLVENGGDFFDVFRAKHPERREAYTHWPQNTGAEVFNYGSRIDHILIAGSCLHEDDSQQGHNFVTCHVEDCDIMMQFKRLRPGNSPRWKGGRSIKLEGSDHVPVYMSLVEIPDVLQHSTPSLSARYAPEVRGLQQTIVSVLLKRQVAERDKMYEVSSSFPEDDVKVESCSESVEKSSQDPNVSSLFSEGNFSLNIEQEGANQRTKNEHPGGSSNDSTRANMTLSRSDPFNSVPNRGIRKKARQNQWSQLSLKSFFQRSPRDLNGGDKSVTGISPEQANISESDHSLDENFMVNPEQSQLNDCTSTQDESHLNASCTSEMEKSNDALVEWQRIQQLMQSSIPLCKGHHEPCVSRVVKKAGPNSGRRFYVCARAEGPASNPESNCGYFKWAASKPKGKR
ncbi:DNA-(apurinic or apyrimidinic site) endonuclease 2 [Diospyros lotus]|uniref:DNA-(apurinic or apyrimidinic site) endonuclease 2 n=1 Tax=Diospyros lotus TaxID=55363 RepID=UPI00224D8B7F|nr:DNA-(apurinic or apyrimidinic site) endonuclease 2 [Diospyros lotus]